MIDFSWQRFFGLLMKEFNQFRRDRTTFIMIIGIPIIQLVMFGFAINTNPKHLPIALIDYDHGPFARTLIKGLENTGYFLISDKYKTEQAANNAMAANDILFILTIPSDFSKKIVRGDKPIALLEADGSDPVSIGYALSAANGLMSSVFQFDFVGPLRKYQTPTLPVELRTHVRYNPEIITQYNIVPGLMGTILTITLVMVASMALTREQELGTLESLLMTPALPIEVIISKVLPYVVVGYLQIMIIVFLATTVFAVPMRGNIFLLFLLALPFILSNLSVGMTISTLSSSQLQASQTGIFFFLPSMLLSGFMFPFQGMPMWAQYIGIMLPMTHFIALARGIMLKGIGFYEAWPNVWPILVFMLLAFYVAMKRYRKTLD